MQPLPISAKGFEKANEKLSALKREAETLPAIIKAARDKGDLKENGEYHAARERQGMLNAAIQHIASQITQSQILNPTQLNKNIVTFGKTVRLKNIEAQTVQHYTLVGPAETNFWENAISVTTSMARALLGKKRGDKVAVATPSGDKHYEILAIDVMKGA